MSTFGGSWGSAWGDAWGSIDSGAPGGGGGGGGGGSKRYKSDYDNDGWRIQQLHADDETLIFAIAALVASGRLH